MINLQKIHTLENNEKLVGGFEKVIVEKESKMSKNQWAGRIDSNKWVIFDKKDAKIGDILPIQIIKARGITLQGQLMQNLEAA